MCWSYYGTKKLLASRYPRPKFKKVIEPFAGAAAYSLHHWENDVTLCDRYDVVARLWKWLQKCSTKDIMSLPNLRKGDTIKRKEFDCDEAFWLVGFFCQTSAAAPGQTVTEFSDGDMESRKKYVASCLEKIRHWNIIEGTYYSLPNDEATWFIDPPYQKGGEHYVHSNISYSYLGKWCKERNGHIIVCENTNANWLPFKPVVKLNGTVKKTVEAIWSNYPTAFDNEQLKMQF